MKYLFAALSFSLFTSVGAYAKVSHTLSSDEIATLSAKGQKGMTGQDYVVKFSDKTAECQVNTMAELPGWSCVLKYKSGAKYAFRSEDVPMIVGKLRSRMSGQGATIKTEHLNVTCQNNTFAELPGFRCVFN